MGKGLEDGRAIIAGPVEKETPEESQVTIRMPGKVLLGQTVITAEHMFITFRREEDTIHINLTDRQSVHVDLKLTGNQMAVAISALVRDGLEAALYKE